MPFTFFWNRKKKALKKEINDLNQVIVCLKDQFNNDRNVLEENCIKTQEELQATQLQLKKVFESIEEEQNCKALLKQDLDLKSTTIEDLKEQLEPFVPEQNSQNSLLTEDKNNNKQLLLSNDSLSQELCVKEQLILKLSDAHEKIKSLEQRLVSEKQMEELQKKMEHRGRLLKEREDELQEKEATIAQLTNDLEEQEFLVQTLQENHEKMQGLAKEIKEVMKEQEEERTFLMTQLSELKQIVKEKTTANDELVKEKEEALRINKELSAEIEETCVQSALQVAEELKSTLQDERDKKQNLLEVSRTENETRTKHVQELIEKYEHDHKSSLLYERNKKQNLLEVSRTENQTKAKDFVELKDRFDLNHRLLLQERSENEALRKKIQDLEEGIEKLREDFNSSPKDLENLSFHVKCLIEQFEKAKTQTIGHSYKLEYGVQGPFLWEYGVQGPLLWEYGVRGPLLRAARSL